MFHELSVHWPFVYSDPVNCVSTTTAYPVPPLSPVSPVAHFGPIAPSNQFAHVAPLGHISPSNPLAHVAHLGPTSPVSHLSHLSHFGPIAPSNQFAHVAHLGPTSPVAHVAHLGPTSPVAHVAPVSPFSPITFPQIQVFSHFLITSPLAHPDGKLGKSINPVIIPYPLILSVSIFDPLLNDNRVGKKLSAPKPRLLHLH